MSFDLHLCFQILCALCCRLPQVLTIHGQEELCCHHCGMEKDRELSSTPAEAELAYFTVG